MKKIALIGALALGLTTTALLAQEADSGLVQTESTVVARPAAKKPSQFYNAVFGSGPAGVALWLALVAIGVAAVYFIVDCAILIRPQKIMPDTLIGRVREAMAEGDVVKAIKACDSEPGSLANILSAGFSHVEEGYDIIQEAVANAADLETERLMQRLTWISVCANIAPMAGLLGTVQGMIFAFQDMSTGQVDIGQLSATIGFALWTTAGGLVIAVPAIATYFGLRNNANRIVLRMEAMTMELIKDLRNVEVVNN